MKISLKPYNSKIFYQNRIFDIKSNHNVFYGLKYKLHKFGVDINTIDIASSDVDLFVYCDVPYPWEIKNWLNLLLHRDKNILFVFESPLINPLNQFGFIKYLFRKIYTWNDELIDNVKYFKFFIPQTDLIIRKSYGSKGLASFMISNNSKTNFLRKVGECMGGYGSLHNNRLELVNKLITTPSCMFFGKGWGKVCEGKSNFGGEIKENQKFKKIGKFNYYFAIENCAAPGYITEKIFDAFRSGVVPVYLGAKNITKIIPNDCFVDFRAFTNIEELFKYLEGMGNKEYLDYIKNIKRFMSLNDTKIKWGKKGFVKLILSLT